MDKLLIVQAVEQQRVIGPEQLAQVAVEVGTAPFAVDLLEVDEPLWGSFWQFDVISPGYLLPAVELALLRAIRLDRHWPEDTDVEQFLADLRRAILSPQAGIWTLKLTEAPWVVFAAEDHQPAGEEQPLVTVVWYCASTGLLHAGYRVEAVSTNLGEDLMNLGVVMQRTPASGFSSGRVRGRAGGGSAEWLEAAGASSDYDYDEETGGAEAGNLAIKFDRAILKFRAGR